MSDGSMFDDEQEAVEAEVAHQEDLLEAGSPVIAGDLVAPGASVGVPPGAGVEVAPALALVRPLEGGGQPGTDVGVPLEDDDEGEIDPLDLPDHYDLPMHGSINHCPKCGGDKVRTDYHAHGVLDAPCGTRFGWPNIQNLGEHLCRTCARCKYGWPEEVFSGA